VISIGICALSRTQMSELINGYNSLDEPDSSVSIASGYRLDDRAIEVLSPAGANDFSSSLCVQTGSGVHPASYAMGTGGPFTGGKARPASDPDHLPLLVLRPRMSRSYISSPPSAFMACSGTALALAITRLIGL
jgi:hypothetical protein